MSRSGGPGEDHAGGGSFGFGGCYEGKPVRTVVRGAEGIGVVRERQIGNLRSVHPDGGQARKNRARIAFLLARGKTIEDILRIFGRDVEIRKDCLRGIDCKGSEFDQVQRIAGEIVGEIAGERAAEIEFPVLHAGQVVVLAVQRNGGPDPSNRFQNGSFLVFLAGLDLDLAERANGGAVDGTVETDERQDPVARNERRGSRRRDDLPGKRIDGVPELLPQSSPSSVNSTAASSSPSPIKTTFVPRSVPSCILPVTWP